MNINGGDEDGGGEGAPLLLAAAAGSDAAHPYPPGRGADVPLAMPMHPVPDQGATASPGPRRRSTLSRQRQRIEGHRSAHRILDRGAPFHQSLGTWNIHRVHQVAQLRLADWFHSLVNKSTRVILAVIVAIYLTAFLFFAGLYLTIRDHCDADVDTFEEAFALSVEVMSTIGFGIDGRQYFDGCRLGLMLVTVEVLAGLLIDAFTLGLLFLRLSRGTSRATTVIFSDKALLKKIGSRFFFQFRVCEMRKHQLIEAHVRCYAIKFSDKDGLTSHVMRLEHPDDELGAYVLLSVPQVVSHELDAWSPLVPNYGHRADHEGPSNSYRFPDVVQRYNDFESGNRECPSTLQTSEAANLRGGEVQHLDRLQLEAYLRGAGLEVVCLIEGIDAPTSYTIQARHSYSADDLAWEGDFAKCTFRGKEGYRLDFAAFHKIVRRKPRP